jgi:hypothetical protein
MNRQLHAPTRARSRVLAVDDDPDLTPRDEDGMALASGLREEPAIPIIMLTGRREEAD